MSHISTIRLDTQRSDCWWRSTRILWPRKRQHLGSMQQPTTLQWCWMQCNCQICKTKQVIKHYVDVLPQSVRTQCQRDGIPERYWPEIEEHKAHRKYKKGETSGKEEYIFEYEENYQGSSISGQTAISLGMSTGEMRFDWQRYFCTILVWLQSWSRS